MSSAVKNIHIDPFAALPEKSCKIMNIKPLSIDSQSRELYVSTWPAYYIKS